MGMEKCGQTDEVRNFTSEWGIENAVLQEWDGKVT